MQKCSESIAVLASIETEPVESNYQLIELSERGIAYMIMGALAKQI